MLDSIDSDLFSAFDLHFARFIARFGGADDEALLLAAALVSRATAAGDVCLDLKAWAGRSLGGSRRDLGCPPEERWLAALRACPAVGGPGERRPLVLDDGGRLYLHRYWEYENRLVENLMLRAAASPEDIDSARLKTALRSRFERRGGPEVDWQQVAVAVAMLKRLAVITGGPGTGKTTTVAKILAVWEALQADRPTRVLLAAPTGKAAARLKDTLRASAACDVATVHRLLQPIAGTPLFRHDAGNPLPVDLMIVDEISMIDLALMAKLLDALPPAARLVLIGDRDQLASVEAGSVLSDICGRPHRPGFSAGFGDLVCSVTGQPVPIAGGGRPLQDCIVELQTSHRFSAGSGIGALSRAVNQGDTSAAMAVLSGCADGTVTWMEPGTRTGRSNDLERCVADGYANYQAGGEAAALLQELNRFKVLCAHRAGVNGAATVNRLAERLLMHAGRIRVHPRSSNPWYSGRPVLITQNDYSLGLFNGDIGVAGPDRTEAPDALSVFFRDTAGEGLRRFLPYRLPEHETVYAMTVHKSQGSEFEDVLLILPEEDSPVLSRELLYTALTRARSRFTLCASPDVLASAIRRRIERTSGLRDALWGG